MIDWALEEISQQSMKVERFLLVLRPDRCGEEEKKGKVAPTRNINTL